MPNTCIRTNQNRLHKKTFLYILNSCAKKAQPGIFLKITCSSVDVFLEGAILHEKGDLCEREIINTGHHKIT